MVEDGRVKQADREGNDQSDKAADLGVTEGQEEVNYLGWKYAARLKAYTRMMTKIHEFIIKVRKKQKELIEKKAKEKDPFRHQRK